MSTTRQAEEAGTDRADGRSRPPHADVRGRIVDAATSEFLEKGYARASLRTIAARAGFTKGAVYSNFSSKEELVTEVLSQQFRRLAGRVPGTNPGPDTTWQQVAETVADIIVDQLTHNLVLLHLVNEFATSLSDSRRHAKNYLELRRSQFEAVHQIVDTLTARSTVAIPDDLPQVFEGVMALTMGFATQRSVTADVPSIHDIRAALLTQLHADPLG